MHEPWIQLFLFAWFNCVWNFRWIQLCCFWYSLNAPAFGTIAGFNFVVFDIRWIQLPVCLFAFLLLIRNLSLLSVVVDLTVGCDNTVLPVFDVWYSLKKGNDDVSIRSLRVKRLSCPWLDLVCHCKAVDCSEHERLKSCRDFAGHFVSVNVVPGSWRINAEKSCALLFELSGSTFVETTVVNQRLTNYGSCAECWPQQFKTSARSRQRV